MIKANIIFASAGALLLASCAQRSDPNAPPEYLPIETPAWANNLNVEVYARSAFVRDASGTRTRVGRQVTDIGQGLSGVRAHWHLTVWGQDGIRCNWGSSALEGCEYRNKNADAYFNAKRNASFRF